MKTLYSFCKSLILLSILAGAMGWHTVILADTSETTKVTQNQQVATVNINTASEKQLSVSLIGVGPAKARAIVAYRKANGSFISKDDLLKVKGIGPSLLAKNSAKILL